MDLWAFLVDPQNREVLTWLGGGLVVLAGGAWTVIRFLFPRAASSGQEPASSQHRVTNRNGVAAGRDVRISTRHGMTGWQAILLALAVGGAVLLAAGVAGTRVKATNGSVAVGGSVGGSVTVGAPPASDR